MTGNGLENTEYSIWKESLGSGIRNKSLLNLMWVELKLYEQYQYEIKKELDRTWTESGKHPGKTIKTRKIAQIRFFTYLKDKERLKDIQTLLNCSERTARDYWKTLLYSELMNKTKLETHQRNIMVHFQEKE